MSIEYLLVVYNGDRDVLADGDRVGVTNHTILLAPDEYTITLSGDGYAPPSEDVILEAINSGRARRIVVIAVNARLSNTNCRPRLKTSVRAGTFRPSSCRNPSTPGGSCCGSIPAFSAWLDLKALPAPAEPAIVRKSCPYEDDKTS